jgi:Ca2+-dependent lipid-binding protein
MQALFINKILTLLWPHLSPAIHKEVMKQSRAPIAEALAKIPMVEDVRIDKLDLGERPFRIDSFKSYQTFEDELILETPLFWGGDMKIRVTAVVKVGGMRVDIPVDIGDIQFKALARITIKPLVETLPCVGGVTISLLEEPTVNCDFAIGESADLLSIPGVPLAIKTAIKIVAGKMLIYPNEFSVPLMPGYGLPPPPQGMLHVNVVQANNQASSMWDKVDPYVMLEVREGRSLQTSAKSNDTDPVWGEELDFVVDDPVEQHLKVVVYDNDLVSASVVGGAMVELDGAEFMADPMHVVTLKLPLYAPDDSELV